MSQDNEKRLLQRVFDKAAKKIERESYYEQMWGYSEQDRRGSERQWEINMAFWAGHQYVGWSRRLNGITELKAPNHRILIVDNRLAPKVRDKIARQMGNPGAQVIPMSQSEIDLERARLKERILEHHNRENKLPLKQFLASLWGSVCGTAYSDVDWRDDGGAVYRDGMNEYVEGEIRTKIRGPHEVWQAPDAKLDTFGSWCWVGEFMDVDVARDEYGIKDLEPDGEKYRFLDYRSRMFDSVDVGPSPDASKVETREQVMIKRLWIFPTNQNPEGREVLYINKKEQKQSTLEWFPLSKYINLPFFDNPHGDTEFRQCIPLQKARNRMRSSQQEYQRMMLKGKWVAPKGSELGQTAFSSEHSEVLWYNANAGPPPTQMQLQSMPADSWHELEINDQSMDDLFANRPSSQGKRETGVNSGRMTALLQEEDDRAHTPGVSLYEEFWKQTFLKVLDCAGKHYTTGKQVTTAGKDMEWEIITIRREEENTEQDLLGGMNRVEIGLGSSLPANKTLRRQVILENYDRMLYGEITDPVVKRKVLQMTGDGVVDNVYDEEKLDEAMAVEENQRLTLSFDGQTPEGEIAPEVLAAASFPPEPIENHPIHMKIHKRAMKSWDFKQMHPVLKQGMISHLEMHEDMYMEQMEAAMAQQAAAEGNQPATPKPPSQVAKETGA